MRWSLALVLAGSLGCATRGVVEMMPPPPTFEQKVGWIVRLEDQRILAEPLPEPAVPAESTHAATPAQVPRPDLLELITDPDVQIRRRAALAVGRVGLADGVPALVAALGDLEPEVRQIAAFGLGLLGDARATAPLVAALADPVPTVQGRAAQALGLLGRTDAAEAIGELVVRLARGGEVTQILAENLAFPLSPEVEAFRLGVYALARLRAYEPLAAAVIAENGQPLVRWWPVAFALQYIADARSVPALVTFARSGGPGAAFGAQGLGAIGGPEASAELHALIQAPGIPSSLAVAAVDGLALHGDRAAVPSLLELLRRQEAGTEVRLAVVRALGRLGSTDAIDHLLDLASDRVPSMRAAALDALADLDEMTFVTVLSGLGHDPHWSVRAALARTLSRLDPAIGLPRLGTMLDDEDQRVVPVVLESLARLRAPDVEAILTAHLQKPDAVVRMAAARGLGDLARSSSIPALVAAYDAGQIDSTYVARAAALTALAEFETDAARDAIARGLEDKDWAVRRHAAMLLRELGDARADPARIRPAPTTRAPEAYREPQIVQPAVSPHVYLDTAKGTIQIELAVLDAPLTVDTFVTLAREGYYDGLPLHRVTADMIQGGDRRGDGAGGPGFTLRDEVNEMPFLRGTLGLARDWEDTGGSQFFITRTPQPMLDARFTAFGTVLAGVEILDGLEPWDVIQRVRVWDGTVPP